MDDCLKKYTNDASRFLVIEGTLVHYRIEGKGQPLLLLHGAFSSLHTFDAWTNILKQHYQVIRLDLPGLGLSPSPTWISENGVQVYVHYLQRFLEILGIRSCAIAGSSLGGWLAWELALARPQLVDKMILLAAAGYMDGRSVPTPFQMARTPVLGKVATYTNIPKTLFKRFLSQVYYDKTKINQALFDRYYELFSREGHLENFYRLVNGKFRDHIPLLPKIKTPTLIIWGEHDEWLPLANAFRFKDALPNSELIIYDDLGHVLMEEAPVPTAQDVVDFLEDNIEMKAVG